MKNIIELKAKYVGQALITGASSGIGKAMAEQLAAVGWDLVIVGRNYKNLQSLQKRLECECAVSIDIIVADLATENGVEEVIENSKEIGLFIHAAGVESHGDFTEQDVLQESALIALNINSTMRLSQHFARQMTKRGAGGILLVSSLTGHLVSPYFATYSASKAYVLQLGLSLHAEMEPMGVDVSVLSPGLTQTAMFEQMGKDIDWSRTPMKAMKVDEVAYQGLKLLGKKASIIPGRMNRITAFVAKRMDPSKFGKGNLKMMKKAFIQPI